MRLEWLFLIVSHAALALSDPVTLLQWIWTTWSQIYDGEQKFAYSNNELKVFSAEKTGSIKRWFAKKLN